MNRLNIDEISTRIYSDIKGLLANFKTEDFNSSRDILQGRIEKYLTKAHKNGDIYFVPKVKLSPKVYTHVDTVNENGEDVNVINHLIEKNSVNLELYHPESNVKIEAVDQLISPLSKFSSTEE